MRPSPHQRTIPSNHTPPPLMTTQPPLSTISNVPVQTHIPAPSFQTYTLNVPTCAPFSNQLQFFDGTDYRFQPELIRNCINTRTVYQLGLEPTNPDQKHTWHARWVALVGTSLDGPAFSWFISYSEADTQDWSTFTLKFLTQFNSVTAQYKAQAQAQNVQLNTHEYISICFFLCLPCWRSCK